MMTRVGARHNNAFDHIYLGNADRLANHLMCTIVRFSYNAHPFLTPNRCKIRKPYQCQPYVIRIQEDYAYRTLRPPA